MICKNCGSEVSPYITECPYCGNRLRKRAPKLDRDGRGAEKRRARAPTPSLPRLRRGEIPGIRADSRPYATMALVLARRCSAACCGARRRVTLVDLARRSASRGGDWWRVVTAPFVYSNTGYAFVALVAIGALRHAARAPLRPAARCCVFFAGRRRRRRAAPAALDRLPGRARRNGAALGLLCAWAVHDLLGAAPRRGDRRRPARRARVVAVAARRCVASPRPSRIAAVVGGVGGAALGALSRSRCSRRSGQTTRIAPGAPSTSAADRRRPGRVRALGRTPTSRPPEVIASHSSQRRASGTSSAKSRTARRQSRLRRVPPATARLVGVGQQLEHAVDGRHRLRPRPRRRRRWPAPARAGGRAARSRSRRSSRGRRRPARPPAASRLSVVITVDGRGRAALARRPRLSAVDTAPAPSGLVSTSASPARPPALVSTSSGCTIPVTARPYFGSASSIEWPPTIATPASAATRRRRRAGSRQQDLAAELVERERDQVQRA